MDSNIENLLYSGQLNLLSLRNRHINKLVSTTNLYTDKPSHIIL